MRSQGFVAVLILGVFLAGMVGLLAVDHASRAAPVEDAVVRRAQLAEAQAVVELYEVRLANAKVRGKQALARLKSAEEEYARGVRLRQTGAMSEQQFDDLRLQLDVARAAYDEDLTKEAEAMLKWAKCRQALVEAGVWPPVVLEK